MEKTATLYVIHCGNDELHNPEKIVSDFDFPGLSAVYLFDNNGPTEKDFSKLKTKDYWKIFMYSNEYLEFKLKRVLPFYLFETVSDSVEIYSIYKIVYDPEKGDRFFISPRIFRSYVEIKSGSLEPVVSENWQHLVMLDGWVKEINLFEKEKDHEKVA